ncbi:RNA polymerase sigma-70 factor [Chitinophaga japonensis]|uniref:RNA polymerase sigma-70 factor (ECF subfamily) n=1 Tax=Chitinophaga japonensis TaxID=104662 RepID=A0A562TBM8_CHIJA|nr:RNA polymerase sigma-70 factor [Chitinophaga japonensis]TWI90987.1 RNA polymerase sigma-70 factor (ECF subfamily) [Chitinophaga japonensis]
MELHGNLNNQKELLCRIAAGDQRAFSLLVDTYASAIYAHVLTYIKEPALSEEITQDIFLKIWHLRSSLPGIDNFPGYLHVMTRNRTISELRKALGREGTAEVTDTADLLTPSLQLEYRQLSDILLRGIELLPPRRRQVFRMSRFEGMSYERIAGELGISKGTVNEHMVQALLFLRSYLKRHMDNAVSLLLLLVYELL